MINYNKNHIYVNIMLKTIKMVTGDASCGGYPSIIKVELV